MLIKYYSNLIYIWTEGGFIASINTIDAFSFGSCIPFIRVSQALSWKQAETGKAYFGGFIGRFTVDTGSDWAFELAVRSDWGIITASAQGYKDVFGLLALVNPIFQTISTE